MALRREGLVGDPRPHAWTLRLAQRAALLNTEIALGSADMMRVSAITVAIGLQTAVLYSPGHFRPAGSLFFALFVPLGTLASLALALTVTLPWHHLLSSRLRRGIGLGAMLGLLMLSIVGAQEVSKGVNWVIQGRPYTNDGAAMDLYAAGQVLDGHNPYRETSIVLALADINAPASTTTPLMEGQFRGATSYPSDTNIQQVFLNILRHQPRTIPPEFESKYNYPAGSFLVILPFVWAGLHDMRFLYALALIAMGWYLARLLPRALRPLAPILVLADVPLMSLTAGGQPDPVYGLFLLVGLAEWDSPWLSPIALGLAAGTKQLAWFFLPLYLVLILRRFGPREALRRIGIMAGVFLLLNGVFLAQSPVAYLTSIAAPMSDPMFPLGTGIIALFVANVLPMVSKAVFAGLEAGAWIGGVAASARLRLAPATMAALGALPLFFAWRSLVNYFYLVPLLALCIVLADTARHRWVEQRSGAIEASG